MVSRIAATSASDAARQAGQQRRQRHLGFIASRHSSGGPTQPARWAQELVAQVGQDALAQLLELGVVEAARPRPLAVTRQKRARYAVMAAMIRSTGRGPLRQVARRIEGAKAALVAGVGGWHQLQSLLARKGTLDPA
jgi:hypothetical protein